MIRMVAAAVLFGASAAMAAPKLATVVAKPNPAQLAAGKAPQVEIAVSINRTKFDKGSCDARLEFGDGQGRNLEFGVAITRTVHHAYRKEGSYTIAVRGGGATPCEGAQQTIIKVAGAPKKKFTGKKETK